MAAVHPLLARLIARRKHYHLSQTTVAKLIGVSKTSICEMERGHHEPRFGTLLGYADAVGFKLIEIDHLHRIVGAHRFIPGARGACSCGWTADDPGETHADHVIALIELEYRTEPAPLHQKGQE